MVEVESTKHVARCAHYIGKRQSDITLCVDPIEVANVHAGAIVHAHFDFLVA